MWRCKHVHYVSSKSDGDMAAGTAKVATEYFSSPRKGDVQVREREQKTTGE